MAPGHRLGPWPSATCCVTGGASAASASSRSRSRRRPPPATSASSRPAARSRAARWCCGSRACSTCRSASATSSCSPPATRPSIPRRAWRAEDASLVAAALQRMLSAHEPYPAVVMDRHWNILDRNHAAHALFGWLLRERASARPRQPDPQLLRPRGAAPARRQLGRGRGRASSSASTARRSAACPTPRPPTLLSEVLAYPGVPAAWRSPTSTRPLLPVVPVDLQPRRPRRSATSPPSPRSARRRTRCSRSCAWRACTRPTSRPRGRRRPEPGAGAAR